MQHAPFGVYLVDSDFRIAQVSDGSAKAFANVQPVLGRDLAEVLKAVWPAEFAEEATARFRHTLETGEPYHQSSLEETRHDTGADEAYDWQIERVTMPDGKFGVVCYYYDLTAEKRAEAALRASEERFRNLADNIPQLAWIADAGTDGKVHWFNKSWLDYTGTTLEQMAGSGWEIVHHPDHAPRVVEKFKHHVREGLDWEDTFPLRGKDGQYRWFLSRMKCIRDDTGAIVRIFGTNTDITERNEAVEYQRFLLSELAHRMKNQLAVIQAMAGQTARNAGSLKEFREQFAQRVQGLAVATDLLVSQGWTGAQLGELVRRQVQLFVPAPERLECEGANVSISPDAAQAIGLALHELATNAVKHGAWSGTGGRVKISWQIKSDGATGSSLRLNWQEHDGPAVEPPTRKGFGHVVMQSVAAQRVDGAAELVFAPEGLIWTMTIPKTHIVERGGALAWHSKGSG